MYDCIIVGMGCAGMSAGIYAKRAGLNTLMVDEAMPGENLSKISVIENYLGFKSITGSELALQMFEHIKAENVPYKITKVEHISINEDGTKTVSTSKGDYITKGVIIAGGRKYKKSGLKNEDKFVGKGISYCAVCDGPLYKNKTIVVLGGGNSAFEEAAYLSRFAKSVTIIVRGSIKADMQAREQVNKANIKIIAQRSVVEFLGNEYITGVKLDDDTVIDCDGVFIYFGTVADTSFIKELDITDENGYILVDNCMKTKYDGIYACGDVIKKELYQIATAVSDGAVAATCLKRELDK
jgi:thioredoxin reductase (NADPH)